MSELQPNQYDFKLALKNCTWIDEYGFNFKAEQWWRKETDEEAIKRLEFNLILYQLYLENGSRFPQETIDARIQDLVKLKILTGVS